MRIKYYRKMRELTQAQLANMIGVTQSYICNLECCRRRNPNVGLLIKIASVLDVTLEELMSGEDDAVRNG